MPQGVGVRVSPSPPAFILPLHRLDRMIKKFSELVPKQLLDKHGFVFFSGRHAFSARSDLYILGANPGGSPDDEPDATLSKHIDQVLHDKPGNWSAYRDDSWYGRAPGKSQMQRRMLHLFNELGLDPGKVPCSEVVFLRSKDLSRLSGNFNQLADECWPLHQAVIEHLSVRVVACLGKPAGNWVRNKLGAHTLLDEFKDTKPGYTRGWKSETHVNSDGMVVVRLAHPSRAIWTDPLSDPTILVKHALMRAATKRRTVH